MAEWLSGKPVRCDFCNRKFGEEGRDEFIDGATMFGPWMLMCKTCHTAIGRGLGIGKGQLYNWLTMKLVQGGRQSA